MAGYIGPVPTPQATQTRDYFTATAGQTSFPTSGYTPGYLDVYLNGVHLQDSDFTATDGTDVVLNDPCAADDVVLVVAWTTFEAMNVDYANVQNTPTALSEFTNDSGYATQAYVDALDALPDQTGSSGKYLTTDGSTASWGEITDPTPAAVSGQSNSATDFFALPSGTTAQRPASASVGYIRHNSDDNVIETYDGTNWVVIGDQTGSYEADVFIVAGGGSGGYPQGSNYGGGGGAGGLVWVQNISIASATSYSIVVGAGGSAKTTGGNGNKGSNSSAFGLTAIGGGGGGAQQYSSSSAAQDGGSGGGGGYPSGGAGAAGQGIQPDQIGNAGIYGFGNDGGAGNTNPNGGGGGGGAGSAGLSGNTSTPPNGGSGQNFSSQFGTTYGESGWFAGGGGGSNQAGYPTPSGGQGGGGRGTVYNTMTSLAGTANTGGGGGAGSAGGASKAGGSGIVIIRYPGSQKGFGGAVYAHSGYTIHVFTSSGTYTG